MIYTSGIISDVHREESLEELQDNKMAIVCEKIGLGPNDRLLDIGCGWGTFAKFASTKVGDSETNLTLSPISSTSTTCLENNLFQNSSQKKQSLTRYFSLVQRMCDWYYPWA
jgi:cyclopropane fatty-acyl-phospholipid synthase-like methyltransferase